MQSLPIHRTASGGQSRMKEIRTTNQKYSSMSAANALPDFDGDNKDQRSWTHWMAEWLYDVRKACKKGAPICLFIDWRQYPSITDALQWAGWIWRGTAVMTSRQILFILKLLCRNKSSE